jgi:hypothetical protein
MLIVSNLLGTTQIYQFSLGFDRGSDISMHEYPLSNPYNDDKNADPKNETWIASIYEVTCVSRKRKERAILFSTG